MRTMINLTDTLEILIITYNHKQYLQETLAQLLAENSPVKCVQITLLDNCSTDGTSELIDSYCAKYANVKHVRHTKNIGGNANIARAFELATKPYFWVLADNDRYDFTHFQSVVQAMQANRAIIVVNTEETNGEKEIYKIFRHLTFLPACIYRHDLIDEYTLRNVYDAIPTWFPHVAALCEAVNRRQDFFICPHSIVIQDHKNKDGYASLRQNTRLSPAQQHAFFDVGYLNALEMIADKTLRAKTVNYFTFSGHFFQAAKNTFKCNRLEHQNYSRNLTGPWAVFNFWQRVQFAAAILFDDICYFLKYPKYYLRRRKTKK